MKAKVIRKLLGCLGTIAIGSLLACAPAAPTAVPTAPAKAPTPVAAAAATQPAAPPAAAATPAPTAAPTSPPVAKVKRGGTLRDVQLLANDSLDPQLCSARGVIDLHLLFDTFMRYPVVDRSKNTFEVRPGLAESFTVINPTTVELKLQKGVKFHDGTDFNAETAKWNLDRAATHAKSQVKPSVAAIKEVQVVDANTIRLLLKAPSAALAVQLGPATTLYVGVVSKQAVESMGDEKFGANPVGTGPMKLKQWVRDQQLALEKFPGHYEKGEDGQPIPYFDSYLARFITDSSVALLEIRAGNLDSFLNLELKDVATVRSNPDLVAQEIYGLWKSFPGFYFNPRKGTPYPFSNNQKLRQAAGYATDQAGMAKTLGFGIGSPAYYPYWFPGMLGYDESLPRRQFDLAKANCSD